jgi:hypothetical protein
MGLLSGNSCNIITLLPLGLKCSSIDASTPQSTNGLLSLQVTGGTAPYNITWSNGQQGSLLTNVAPGLYTATVVDYYGDFTGTTTCEVGYDSFYLNKFEDCSNPGEYVYYLADLVNPLLVGSIYKLTTQIGCWTNSGNTLFNGQSYINSTPVASDGPFNTCVDCLPVPIPAPVYPQNLCFELTQNNSVTQINFSSGNTINNYPSWSSVTPSYTIYYNSGTTKWLISGWTSGGSPYNQSPTAPPTGNWVLVGGNSFNSSLLISTGTCLTPPLTMRVQKTNPSCSLNTNGSIVITGYGGVPSYTYSMDGLNYQPSNVFLNLGAGQYTAYVKDSNNTVASQSFTMVAQQTFQSYSVSLVLTPGQVINNGTSSTRTSTWSITTSPTPLPVGTTISMSVSFNVLYTGYTATSSFGPTITNNITFNTNPNFVIGSGTSTSPVGTSVNRPVCEGGIIYTSANTTTYNIQLTNNGFASGTIVQYINTPCVETIRCELQGYLKDSISVQNLTITPNTCRSVSSKIDPQSVTTQKIGLICYG